MPLQSPSCYMQYLFIVRSAPVSSSVHEALLGILNEIALHSEHSVTAIFFADAAAPLGAEGMSQIESLKDLQDKYLQFSKKNEVPLLICGRAYMEHGLKAEYLKDGYTLSGNMELSMMIADADRVVEF